jgi:protein O-GlcNAc transferase
MTSPILAPGPAAQKILIDALAVRAKGQFRDAAVMVANLLGDHPTWADAHAAMAVLCADLGASEPAMAHAGRAVALAPRSSRHHENRLSLAERFGHHGALPALALLWTQHCPEDARAWLRFAALVLARGADESERVGQLLDRAEVLAPGNAEILALRGELWLRLGRPAEARAALERALERATQPGEVLYWSITLAVACLRLDDARAALAVLARFDLSAADIPTEAKASIADLRATALRVLARPDEALRAQEVATAVMPGRADYWHNLGIIHRDRADVAAAQAAFDRAIVLTADSPNTQPMSLWARALAAVPVICADDAQIDTVRAALLMGLDRLADQIRLNTPNQIDAWRRAAGSMQTFHAAYHGRDDRSVQQRLGAMIRRIMLAAYPWAATAPPMPPRRNGKVHVAVATAHVYEHSVWKIPLRGWLQGLDRSRFFVSLYHLGGRVDAETEQAQRLADAFFHSPGDETAVVTALRADPPHVLLFPEIGMDPAVLRLAALNLAPVQAVGLGHPVTTGLSSIGWYLTSQSMQTERSDALFGERLVRLPGMGVCYTPLERHVPPYDRAHFGLPDDRVLLLSPQSLFKYQPRHDALLARIAAGAPQAALVFIEGESAVVTAVFQQRLQRAFAALGLAWREHCIFVPRQTGGGFQRLCAVCDLFLDSVGWSGFNTACEAAAAGLPMVTWPCEGDEGAQTHARHGAAVLTQMGLPETIADSADAYVAMVIALAGDDAGRAALAARVRTAVPRLWGDAAPIRAMELWIEQAVEEAGKT